MSIAKNARSLWSAMRGHNFTTIAAALKDASNRRWGAGKYFKKKERKRKGRRRLRTLPHHIARNPVLASSYR